MRRRSPLEGGWALARTLALWLAPWPLLLSGGCMEDVLSPPVSSALAAESHQPEPIGMQMVRAVPDLRGQRYTNLLHFEDRTDAVFVAPAGLTVDFDEGVAHTGRTSLRLNGNGGKLSVKLGSLLGDRPFPGDWTMGGAYFYSDSPAQITVTTELAGRAVAQNRIELPPRQWAAAMVDLAGPADVGRIPPAAGAPSLSFTVNSSGDVWCDDVLLIDNTQWLVGDESAGQQGGGQWSVRRRGFNYVCETRGRFTIRLTTAEVMASGWRVEEANDIRVRFSSTGGKNKSLTIYRDGRSYWDGEFKPLAADLRGEPLYAQQKGAPAQIDIPDTMGRVERRSAGDANNDGYDEARGAYMLLATGPRLEFTVTPGAAPAFRPIFEISGLPPGKPLATVEGRLIEQARRLDDGTLLIEVPGRITRPTVVNVRVQ